MRVIRIALLISIHTMAVAAFATIFGSVRGVIHDPQHRPIQGAMVMLKSKSSDWAKSATTDANIVSCRVRRCQPEIIPKNADFYVIGRARHRLRHDDRRCGKKHCDDH